LESEIEEKRATLAELTTSVENLPTRREEWDLLEKELADLEDRIELKRAIVNSLEDRERALGNATVPSPPVTRSRTHNRPMSVALWLRRLSEGSIQLLLSKRASDQRLQEIVDGKCTLPPLISFPKTIYHELDAGHCTSLKSRLYHSV
jgi:DNA repair exonuclease SbcCD ATPase subunit